MTSTRLFFILIIAAVACTASAQSNKAVTALIKTKFALMNEHDINKMSSLYADSARIQSVGFDQTEIGPQGFKNVYVRYFKTSPDLVYEVTKTICSDTSAVVEYTSKGTMVNLESNSPAYMKGKPYVLKNCTVFMIRDGKIISEMTYFDQLSFLRQMDFFNHK